MNKNISILTDKIFKNQEKISLDRIKKLKKNISEEITFFKFHSMQLKENGTLPIEEFCKSIFSNSPPRTAYKRINCIEHLVKSGRVQGETTFQDFLLINRFFNEYKNYFKLEKTSNGQPCS